MNEPLSELHKTAFHGAGHAVAGLMSGRLLVESVSIEPNEKENCSGITHLRGVRLSKKFIATARRHLAHGYWGVPVRHLEAEIEMLLAGPISELTAIEIITGKSIRHEDLVQGGYDDISRAYKLISAVKQRETVRTRYLTRLLNRTAHLIHIRWHMVDCLANLLLERRTMSLSEIRKDVLTNEKACTRIEISSC